MGVMSVCLAIVGLGWLSLVIVSLLGCRGPALAALACIGLPDRHRGRRHGGLYQISIVIVY